MEYGLVFEARFPGADTDDAATLRTVLTENGAVGAITTVSDGLLGARFDVVAPDLLSAIAQGWATFHRSVRQMLNDMSPVVILFTEVTLLEEGV